MDPSVAYRFENPESGKVRELCGADLQRDGFTFSLPKRAAAFWLYRIEGT